MPCGWEGNRRSGVALAMRHKWFIHLRAHGLRNGDEHPLPHSSKGHGSTLSVVDFRLMDTCESIDTCVKMFDTLAATTLHTIPALTDQQLATVC